MGLDLATGAQLVMFLVAFLVMHVSFLHDSL